MTNGIQAFTHLFDMAGHKLSIDSKDAGLKQILLAVDGQPMQTWDANGHQVVIEYDELRRPVKTWVTSPEKDEQGNITGTVETTLNQVTIYGEKLGSSAPAGNHRGMVYAILDSGGLALNLRYDFKGNLEHNARRLTKDYKARSDWQSIDLDKPISEILTDVNSILEAETFYASSKFDALNRVTQSTAPDHSRLDWSGLPNTYPQDGSVYRFTYNEASLLEQVVVDLQPTSDSGLPQIETFVRNINYNAKGQRTLIDYGNGVTTEYDYYSDTFRLHRVLTRRNGTERLQDLHYTYDPVGNITQIEDRVFHTVFNHNDRIEPINRYTYDPLYRLIKASGREHEQMGPCHYSKGDQKQTEIFALTQQPINNGQALRNYAETYTYDKSGNITRIHHIAGDNGNWTRNQTYAADCNRLSTSDARCADINSFSYPHDGNGNILKMPHLKELVWDYANRLEKVTNRGNGDASITAFYTYDAGGQRLRKVIEKGDKKSEERIYLGDFEIHRSYNTNSENLTLDLERQSLHVMDDQKRIALVETRTQGNDGSDKRRIRYQLDNHLGSSLMEVSENGKVISYEEYLPYGGTAYLAGENEAEVKRKRYRYSGKERDDETGLYYYGARYYAPWLGRWMSCDPAGTIDGFNLYEFLINNPIINLDTKGLDAENYGEFIEVQEIHGKLYAHYRTTEDTWISAATKKEGLDKLFPGQRGFGAYSGKVLDLQGKPVENPDEVSIGYDFFVPIVFEEILVSEKTGEILDKRVGDFPYIRITKETDPAQGWENSQILKHALNISGESGGAPSKKGEPVNWMMLQDHTEALDQKLAYWIPFFESRKEQDEIKFGSYIVWKSVSQNLYLREMGTDGAPLDIKRTEFAPKRIGEWSFYQGKLRRYDDYGNYLFGAVGAAFGFEVENLILGAEINQQLKFNEVHGPDDPRDIRFIRQGYDFYLGYQKRKARE